MIDGSEDPERDPNPYLVLTDPDPGAQKLTDPDPVPQHCNTAPHYGPAKCF
jgi:hypothetical protein